jgi:hypothetical protein
VAVALEDGCILISITKEARAVQAQVGQGVGVRVKVGVQGVEG